ncbi:MAG TPA: tryptophan-rich sensory protein [Chthoniobacterales bacterium]
MNPTLLALIICIATGVLEGVLAGGGVRQRLAELRMPPYSPPFALWLVIGAAYYAICFTVLRYLLRSTSSPSITATLCLLTVILLANALWSVFFFRWRDLRLSFLAFVPYALVVVALVILLVPTYPFGAALFLCYGCYLIYATWWGYRLWRLNDPKA